MAAALTPPAAPSTPDESDAAVQSCHDAIVALHQEAVKAATRSVPALPEGAATSSIPRALEPSNAAEAWCLETFSRKYPRVPRSTTSSLCAELKRLAAVAEPTEEGAHDIAEQFCARAERRYLEAFKAIVKGQQLGGHELVDRFQLDNDELPRIRSFFGARSHNAIDQDSWDVVSPCCKPHSDGGCADESVSTCVCDRDKFCCQNAWDVACVKSVETLGCGTCGAKAAGAEAAKHAAAESSEATSKPSGSEALDEAEATGGGESGVVGSEEGSATSSDDGETSDER
jgi:hypothetical protein